MNATTRNRNKLYPLATAAFLAIALAAAAPAMAKSDKPYHEAPDDGAAQWNEQEQFAAEYIYVCRIGSAIKYRIEPRDSDFFDLGNVKSEYRLAPRLGTCA